MINRFIPAISILLLAGASEADDKYPLQSFDFIHETYFIATPANRGLVHRVDWDQVRGRFSDHWLLELSSLQLINTNLLDECYLQYEDDRSLIRGGRLRTVFGLGRWSDLFYNVVARAPMIRYLPVLDNYSLLTFQSGVEAHAYTNGLEITGQVSDAAIGNRTLLPEKFNVTSARVQATLGNTLVGLNGTNVSSGPLASGGQIYGLDFRGGAERWSWMGEWIQASGGTKRAKGYYADLSYRFTHPLRPQLGIRLEGYEWGKSVSNIATAGIRIIASKELSFNLNYGLESPIKLLSNSGAAPYGGTYHGGALEGWSFQTMFAFRFRS